MFVTCMYIDNETCLIAMPLPRAIKQALLHPEAACCYNCIKLFTVGYVHESAAKPPLRLGSLIKCFSDTFACIRCLVCSQDLLPQHVRLRSRWHN